MIEPLGIFFYILTIGVAICVGRATKGNDYFKEIEQLRSLISYHHIELSHCDNNYMKSYHRGKIEAFETAIKSLKGYI